LSIVLFLFVVVSLIKCKMIEDPDDDDFMPTDHMPVPYPAGMGGEVMMGEPMGGHGEHYKPEESDPMAFCEFCKTKRPHFNCKVCKMLRFKCCLKCCTSHSPQVCDTGACSGYGCSEHYEKCDCKRKPACSGDIRDKNACNYVPVPEPAAAAAAAASATAAAVAVAVAGGGSSDALLRDPRTDPALLAELRQQQEADQSREAEEQQRQAPATRGDIWKCMHMLKPLIKRSMRQQSLEDAETAPVECLCPGGVQQCSIGILDKYERKTSELELARETRKRKGHWIGTYRDLGAAGLDVPHDFPPMEFAPSTDVTHMFMFNGEGKSIYQMLADKVGGEAVRKQNCLSMTISYKELAKIFMLPEAGGFSKQFFQVMFEKISCVDWSNENDYIDFVPVLMTEAYDFAAGNKKFTREWQSTVHPMTCVYRKAADEAKDEDWMPERYTLFMKHKSGDQASSVPIFEQNMHDCWKKALCRWGVVDPQQECAKGFLDYKHPGGASAAGAEPLSRLLVSTFPKESAHAPSPIVFFIGRELPHMCKTIFPEKPISAISAFERPTFRESDDEEQKELIAKRFAEFQQIKANVIRDPSTGQDFMVVRKPKIVEHMAKLYGTVAPHKKMASFTGGFTIKFFAAKPGGFEKLFATLTKYMETVRQNPQAKIAEYDSYFYPMKPLYMNLKFQHKRFQRTGTPTDCGCGCGGGKKM
jgi:hypothetical protein